MVGWGGSSFFFFPFLSNVDVDMYERAAVVVAFLDEFTAVLEYIIT